MIHHVEDGYCQTHQIHTDFESVLLNTHEAEVLAQEPLSNVAGILPQVIVQQADPQHSVEISENSKREACVTVKSYGTDLDAVGEHALAVYRSLVAQLGRTIL